MAEPHAIPHEVSALYIYIYIDFKLYKLEFNQLINDMAIDHL